MDIVHIEKAGKCKEILIAQLKEELKDVVNYGNIYDLLKEHGHYDAADDIESIARDEYHHAKILSDILDDWGYNMYDDAEIVKLWQDAKHEFEID